VKYLVIVNDDELRGNGDDLSLPDVTYDISELLRCGYYQVESVTVTK